MIRLVYRSSIYDCLQKHKNKDYINFYRRFNHNVKRDKDNKATENKYKTARRFYH